jgi:hypothetical protein
MTYLNPFGTTSQRLLHIHNDFLSLRLIRFHCCRHHRYDPDHMMEGNWNMLPVISKWLQRGVVERHSDIRKVPFQDHDVHGLVKDKSITLVDELHFRIVAKTSSGSTVLDIEGNTVCILLRPEFRILLTGQ